MARLRGRAVILRVVPRFSSAIFSLPERSEIVTATTRMLVIVIAVVGCLFDTYELLRLPVIGAGALSDLLQVPANHESVRQWMGRLLWISALCGGVFGLAG